MNYIALLAMGEFSGPLEAPGWNRALRWNISGKVRYEYIKEHY